MGRKERLLGGVLGGLTVTEHTQTEVEEGRLIARHKAVERGQIAALSSGDKPFVRGFWRSRHRSRA